MARDILFRGKRTDNGRWVEGWYCQKKTGHYEGDRFVEEMQSIIIASMTGGGYQYAVADPGTICQYTGKHDRNGRRIFEGDIVRDIFNASVVGVVRYGEYRNTFNDEYGGHVGFYIEWKEKRDLLRKDLVYLKNSEFTGNIFDNPELVKGGVE